VIGRLRLLWSKSLAGKAAVSAAFLACVLLAAYFIAADAMARRLKEAWKLSDEFGLPKDFDSLFGEKIPGSDNAAVSLEQAATIARLFLNTERARFKVLQDDLLLQDASYFASMDRLLADPEYENALAEADRRPGYHSLIVVAKPLVYSKIVHLEVQRELVRAEQAIARRMASQGKREEAVRRLLRMHRLTRRWEEKEPFLVAVLTNVSLRTVIMIELSLLLRQGPLASGLHGDVEREIAPTENFLRILPRVAEVEKLAVVDFRDNYALPGPWALSRFSRDEDQAFMIRHIHSWARTYNRPYNQVKSECDAIEAEFLAMFQDPVGKWMHIGSRIMTPAIKQCRMAFDRLIALSRCLRIVNAMARKNDFAADLSSLGLPKEDLIDPFDGKPMRIKKTPNGPVVYSISYDLKDDGGVLDPSFKDVGLGPPEVKPEGKGAQ
jgi:hypothetical protein